jgi:hypothetical protein
MNIERERETGPPIISEQKSLGEIILWTTCVYRRITALDAVDAGVVEFGSGDLQRVEIAVHAVAVTICDGTQNTQQQKKG